VTTKVELIVGKEEVDGGRARAVSSGQGCGSGDGCMYDGPNRMELANRTSSEQTINLNAASEEMSKLP
jgi:hypothetical protein